MNDVFVEQLVKKLPDNKTRMKKALYVLVGIVGSALLLLFLFGAALFLVPIVWVGIYFLFRRENIEYEYIFTSGQLDIDKIINQSARKQVLSIDVRKIEIMTKKENESNYSQFNSFNKIFDFSSGGDSADIYVAVFRNDQDRVKLIFEPNEKVLTSMRMYISNKIKKY